MKREFFFFFHFFRGICRGGDGELGLTPTSLFAQDTIPATGPYRLFLVDMNGAKDDVSKWSCTKFEFVPFDQVGKRPPLWIHTRQL